MKNLTVAEFMVELQLAGVKGEAAVRQLLNRQRLHPVVRKTFLNQYRRSQQTQQNNKLQELEGRIEELEAAVTETVQTLEFVVKAFVAFKEGKKPEDLFDAVPPLEPNKG